ncbi:hypothetical protein B0E45_10175 [Sinorhizobium sp. A49]|uniref:hypothetical protein n=1 Tax=Sinorhizobium sp. A49 TaxID=1945861 RepID=UPI000987088F|nr:hypothetical protein [Sinorhizobium sp. A49]OOG72086.1 hypothetical protein B0E45_10175 [Sinorhizobium sp. A49]
MRHVSGLILSVLFVASSTAHARATSSPFEQARVVQCMLDHTSADDETVFKNLIVAALNDESDSVKSHIVQVSSIMMNLALTKCEVGMSMLADPQFQAAAKIYGQHLGEKLLKKAFDKLN